MKFVVCSEGMKLFVLNGFSGGICGTIAGTPTSKHFSLVSHGQWESDGCYRDQTCVFVVQSEDSVLWEFRLSRTGSPHAGWVYDHTTSDTVLESVL